MLWYAYVYLFIYLHLIEYTHVWIVCMLLRMLMLKSFTFCLDIAVCVVKAHCYNKIAATWHSVHCHFVV